MGGVFFKFLHSWSRGFQRGLKKVVKLVLWRFLERSGGKKESGGNKFFRE